MSTPTGPDHPPQIDPPAPAESPLPRWDPAARRLAWEQVWRRLLTERADLAAAPEADPADRPEQDPDHRRRSPTDSS
jgi:hypothetical protein